MQAANKPFSFNPSLIDLKPVVFFFFFQNNKRNHQEISENRQYLNRSNLKIQTNKE